MSSEERKSDESLKELVYKTKVIQFLGRTTPVILQNDNGPCPLLAICNVLLLKNHLNLSPDIPEVSQEKLLALVAERLIDSNSNVDNKDAGYLENQQQNIADAIDLLPRLATGIDVNIKYKRFDDFEFTPECAIFDLLDIPLYHGWIVDPQDTATADAIGSKSYNTLMGELVLLETRHMEEHKSNPEEDSVDFAAATTATLGVPSPCLSRGISFDDSPRAISDQSILRKGDAEEEEELERVLKLSETHPSISDQSEVRQGDVEGETEALKGLTLSGAPQSISNQSEAKQGVTEEAELPIVLKSEAEVPTPLVDDNGGNTDVVDESKFHKQEPSTSYQGDDSISFETGPVVADKGNHVEYSTFEQYGKSFPCSDVIEKISIDACIENENESHVQTSGDDEKVRNQSTPTADVHDPTCNKVGCDSTEFSSLSVQNAGSDSSSGRIERNDLSEAFTSSMDGSEPIYEGEECILDSGTIAYENREPMYEGEAVLAEQADKHTGDAFEINSKDEITPQQGELIRNFLKNNASQLTIYGLFCLQDGLKERELCVFFRNNHFSTMFKLDGQLYLLATDQGYINQPDLVWEKLNEVNGDTLFMTGNFKEFKIEEQTSDSWNEQNVMASTADYLASIDKSSPVAGSNFNSDLQLAIALQKQEFEQQPPHHNVQQPSVTSTSRLVTGPQVPRSSGRNSSPSKQDQKKEKCTVM